MRCSFSSLWGKLPISICVAVFFSGAQLSAEQAGPPSPSGPRYSTNDQLTLQEYMQRVVDYNETVQGRLLGFHAARRQRLAEMGNFEPTFVATGEYVDRRQPNNFQVERSLGLLNQIGNENPDEDSYPSVFEERNRRYSSSIEVLSPIGTRFRIGATGAELRNNVPRPDEYIDVEQEFETSLAVSIEQPLLKGLGFANNMASLRLAARESEVAFQEYRRELMQVVAEAELAYWDLFYAQEELKLSLESVSLAQTLLDDSNASFEAGRGSKLDVLEAEAGLALRRSRERESFQRSVEAMNRLASFFGGVPKEHGAGYQAVDSPESRLIEMSYDFGIRTALAMNPDLLRAQLQKEQEEIRIDYAKNQRLPELNLTGGLTSSGLGFDWSTSRADVRNISFPAWSVGLVLRVPVWGDVRARNELSAAQLRYMQAERAEGNLMTQLRVGRDTSEQRVVANFTTARSLEQVVEFRVSLLDTRLQSRDIGRMDARSVLEAEQELFVARLEQLQSEIQFQRALLELQMITGSLLQMRDLEMSFAELEYSTRRWIGGDESETFGLNYKLADQNRLPIDNLKTFEGDPVQTPWLGVDWGTWRTEVQYRTPEDEIINKQDDEPNLPRRSRHIGAGNNH